MKTPIKRSIFRVISLVTLVMFMSLVVGDVSYSFQDRRGGMVGGSLSSQSYTPLPGYISKAQSKTNFHMNQSVVENMNLIEETMKGNFNRGLKSKLESSKDEQLKPDLKKKTGGNDLKMDFGSDYDFNVDIGRGDQGSQRYMDDVGGVHDNDGGGQWRLISESFDGVRVVYAGFEDVGYEYDGTIETIINAINFAIENGGGRILIRGNTYRGRSGYYYDLISINGYGISGDGISLMGGYDRYGTRDGSSTVINSGIRVYGLDSLEISGLQINTSMGVYINSCSNVIFAYNTLNSIGAFYGLNIANSTAEIKSNLFTGDTLFGIYGRMSNISAIDNTINSALVGFFLQDSKGFVSGNTFENSFFAIGGFNSSFTLGENTFGDVTTELGEYSSTFEHVSEDPPEKELIETTIVDREGYEEKKMGLSQDVSTDDKYESLEVEKLADIYKKILENGEILLNTELRDLDSEALVRLIRDLLEASGLSIGEDEIDDETLELGVLLLKKLLKQPIEKRKEILELILAFLKIMDSKKNNRNAVEKEQDIMRMFTAMMIAQAVADNLMEDNSALEGLFSRLDNSKDQILVKHAQSTKAYYDSVIGELAKLVTSGKTLSDNIQLKDILEKVVGEDTESLRRNKVDTLLKDLNKKQRSKITSEEENILELIASSREKHLTPAEKSLKEEMTVLINGFAEKMSSTLIETGFMKNKKSGMTLGFVNK